MGGEQAIFNLEIKKKRGSSISPDIHHSKVPSSGCLKVKWLGRLYCTVLLIGNINPWGPTQINFLRNKYFYYEANMEIKKLPSTLWENIFFSCYLGIW